MAIKFDFNKLRTAVKGWLSGTDTTGASLTAGEEAIYVPQMRQGFIVEEVGAAITLTNEDSGKIFLCESSGGAFQITLPTSAPSGLWYRFFVNEETPTQDITIAAGSAIIGGTIKDAGGDVGHGTAGTEVSNIIIDQTAEIGDHIELISGGGKWFVNAQSTINAGIITS